MILTIVFLIFSSSLSIILYYFTHLYEKWYYFFVPILTIPLFYLVLFGLYVVFLYLWSFFLNKKKEITTPKKFWYFFVEQTIFQLVLLSRTKIHFIGKEKIDAKKRYLVVTNHISNFDPIISIRKLGLKPLICVTKKENLKIPVCGAFIHHAGFIPLDRDNPHSGVQMLRTATKYLEEDLASIYICPEGTRSKTGELQEFHAGSFKISKKANVEIVVCAVKNTNLIHKNFPFKRTKTELKILKVISKEEISEKTTVELSLEAYQIIKEEMEKNK